MTEKEIRQHVLEKTHCNIHYDETKNRILEMSLEDIAKYFNVDIIRFY